ncbi:GntR family transcriptional regulator [Rothia uropygioeca]|uniref:GntR family transcriptional regulator n=1 Tax=Kocuria sp. 257 TaxID=2021970 RepID=UPI001012EF7D|nr:GntR family transcriptional regulator [Kocuria sp. 257]
MAQNASQRRPEQASPASATPASDLVYREVKARILDHRLEGGSLISEGEIATDLKVSRTPVREGFIRLQAEGWMTLYPKRGALIRQAGPNEVRDVIEARIVVESHAVESIAASDRGGEVAAELSELIGHQSEALAAHNDEDFAKIDADFHQCIVARAGNSLFIDFFENLKDRQRRMSTRAIWKSNEQAEAVLAHHRELAELIARGDSALFRERLGAHLHEIHERFLS